MLVAQHGVKLSHQQHIHCLHTFFVKLAVQHSAVSGSKEAVNSVSCSTTKNDAYIPLSIQPRNTALSLYAKNRLLVLVAPHNIKHAIISKTHCKHTNFYCKIDCADKR